MKAYRRKNKLFIVQKMSAVMPDAEEITSKTVIVFNNEASCRATLSLLRQLDLIWLKKQIESSLSQVDVLSLLRREKEEEEC